MMTKIATFISVTAFALIGAIAQAKVHDPSQGQHDVSGQILLQLIGQTPFLFGCELGSYADPARSSADLSHQGNVPDIFAGNFNMLEDNLAADSCAVPIPSPEQFKIVAGR